NTRSRPAGFPPRTSRRGMRAAVIRSLPLRQSREHDLPHALHPNSLSRLFVAPSPGRVMPGIDVAHGTGLKEGQSTPGILREQAFESSNVLVSRTRLDPAAVSGWHHHGTHALYGFLLSGRPR